MKLLRNKLALQLLLSWVAMVSLPNPALSACQPNCEQDLLTDQEACRQCENEFGLKQFNMAYRVEEGVGAYCRAIVKQQSPEVKTGCQDLCEQEFEKDCFFKSVAEITPNTSTCYCFMKAK